MNLAQDAVLAVLVALGALAVPLLIARLPEPVTPPEPAEPAVPAESETRLARMLEEEGPKPLYADIARARALPSVILCLDALLMFSTVEHLDAEPAAWVIAVLTPLLLALAYVDARTRLLPRILVLPATGVLLVLAVVEWAVTRATGTLVREVVAMLVARSVFWVLWFVRRSGMGFGDVRLAALVGLVLGRISWSAWIVGLYGGLIAFVLFSVGLLVVRGRGVLKKGYPYGPFMIAGLYLGVLTSGVLTLV